MRGALAISNSVLLTIRIIAIAFCRRFGSDFAGTLRFQLARLCCDPVKSLRLHFCQGPLNGGVSNGGGFPIWTCPSFFIPFCPFWDFPDFSGIFPICPGTLRGFSPICPFPLSRPIKSTYEEQSRKGPRHNLDLSQKKWETPGFGNPPV